MKKSKLRRLNHYFRQTVSAFKSLRQTKVYYHIKRNIAYQTNRFSSKVVLVKMQSLKRKFFKK